MTKAASTLNKHTQVAEICLFLFLPQIMFTLLEIPFVLGIFKEYSIYSERYILSIPLIKSFFYFDFLFLFPVFAVPTFFFFIYVNKKNRFSREKIPAFILPLFYSLSFLSNLANYRLFEGNFAYLSILSILWFFLYNLFFKVFLKDNLFQKFAMAILLVCILHFYTQKISIIYFLAYYSILLLFIVLIFRGFLVNKVSVYCFLGAIISLCFIFFQWSSDPIDIFSKNTAKGHEKPNVILIVLDTFRSDHINADITPSIDLFSKNSLVYKNCISISPWTLPSHASIFTGQYPMTHGAHFIKHPQKNSKNYYPLSSKKTTLTEILNKAGYKSYGVVSNYAYLNTTSGISQGFDFYDSKCNPAFHYYSLEETLSRVPFISGIIKSLSKLSGLYESKLQYFRKPVRLAEDINKSVKRVIKKHFSNSRNPFFLFINYMDTHIPYIPPKEYRDRSKIKEKWLEHFYPPGWGDIMQKKRGMTKEESGHIHAAYKGEAAYLDKELGKFLAYLKNIGVYNDSMIIITSDHGEFLGEHSFVGHGGFSLYNEVLSVPLIVKYPGNKSNGKSSKMVQQVDILPTILKVLDIKIPSFVEGVPLDEVKSQRSIVSEFYEDPLFIFKFGNRFRKRAKSLINFPYKYILNYRSKNELYNIKKDPKEEKNLINKENIVASKMRKTLIEWVKQRKKFIQKKKNKKITTEEVERLKSLGYL